MKPEFQSRTSNDLPALRNFVRGYLHQDMKEEYGSAKGALRAYCEEASSNEKAALARDWSQLMAAEAGQPIEHLNQILIQNLGSSYSVTADEVREMTAILKVFSKTS